MMLRVGMTNPPFILDHLEDIAKVLNRDSVFSFLHVPVQVNGLFDFGNNKENSREAMRC